MSLLIALALAATPADRGPPSGGLHLNVDLLLGRPGLPSGFELGYGFRFRGATGEDRSVTLNYTRITGFGAPATLIDSAITFTAHTETALYAGFGAGALIAQGVPRLGTRIFAGLDLFHGNRLPVNLGAELLAKLCDERDNWCPSGEQQFWFAVRLGIGLF